MRQRPFGPLGTVSALRLGAGGIGQLWGPASRDEGVAMLREAVASGITLLDPGPTYGDGEAARVVGEAWSRLRFIRCTSTR